MSNTTNNRQHIFCLLPDPSMPIPPETERLIFRDWTATDLEPFHSLCSDPRVMQFVGDGEPWSLERTEQFIERAREMSRTLGFCQWPMIHKGLTKSRGHKLPACGNSAASWQLAATPIGSLAVSQPGSAVIGFCGFVPTSDGAEIGWRLAKESWGRGLATEAARAVLKHGFETLGFQRIVATVQSPNLASIRVMEKLGMQPESRFHRNGREVILFSITRQRADIGE